MSTFPYSAAASDPRNLWHPCTQMQRLPAVPPLQIARGSGPWLIDAAGRRYYDAISSWWVNLFGHAHPGIGAALKDQLDTLEHVMLAGCVHRPAAELAERLSTLAGGALGHAFYASDGASAMEIALKMSFHYWRNRGQTQRRTFVRLRGGYHGETLGALAVTDVQIFRDVYAPLLAQSHVAMSPDARQAVPGETADGVAARALADLDALLAKHAGTVAAVVVEPLVQCAAGMAMHDAAYLRGLRALCDRHDVHLIADEIAVGCGRTGTFFAWEQAAAQGQPLVAAQRPDFVCLSKGITAGYLPLSVVLTRTAVYEAFLDDSVARGFLHSHSYTGNPLACRAALAALDLFERESVLEHNRERARWLQQAFAPLTADPRVEHARQRGLIWACDVREHWAGARFAERFHLAARERELLVRPIGNTVYLMPPYVFDADGARWLAERVADTLDAVCREGAVSDPEPSSHVA